MTRPLLVVNDVHLGVRRSAGTTPVTAQILRDSLQGALCMLISKHYDKDLCIAGDLFDAFEVDLQDVLVCYTTLVNWLAYAGPEAKLFLMAGNHDIGKRDDRISSFGFLAEILVSRFRTQVVVIYDEIYSHGNVHMIPHCMNQDLFDMQMERALEVEPGFLILHANVDNGFAENSDHSLNVNEGWMVKLSTRHTLLFAHEHQARRLMYIRTSSAVGKSLPLDIRNTVIVMGNQWPSSVSDCLTKGDAQRDGKKYAHVINGDSVETIETWDRSTGFAEIEWQELNTSTAEFIRVGGTATATQATDVINAIANFRKTSSALVITNGVHIEGMPEMDMEAETLFDRVTSFDVLASLYEKLTAPEVVVVKDLMEETA